MSWEAAQVQIRPAVIGDGDLLLAWRNDPAARCASLSTAGVTTSEHRAWLEAVVADPRRRLWIAELGRVPVGQVRLDDSGDVETISVSVAPSHRGQRLATPVIVAACAQANRRIVVARIRRENLPSIAAFAAAGFELVDGATDDDVLVMERSAPPMGREGSTLPRRP